MATSGMTGMSSSEPNNPMFSGAVHGQFSERTRHGNVRDDRHVERKRQQRGDGRATGRRAVFRHRALRHVQVHLALLQRAIARVEVPDKVPRVRLRDLEGLLEHVAQLPCMRRRGAQCVSLTTKGFDQKHATVDP